jgi:hypothetical protein
MAQQKPLGLPIVQEWLAAWDESNIFSDAAEMRRQNEVARLRVHLYL